jgi:hypothetical protein
LSASIHPRHQQLPVIGLSHSLGGKLTALLSLEEANRRRVGNIYISFNNYAFDQGATHSSSSSPSSSSSSSSSSSFESNLDEFIPTSSETWSKLKDGSYQIGKNVMMKFDKDPIDQSIQLRDCIESNWSSSHQNFGKHENSSNRKIAHIDNMVCIVEGGHLTPIKLFKNLEFLDELTSLVSKIICQ